MSRISNSALFECTLNSPWLNNHKFATQLFNSQFSIVPKHKKAIWWQFTGWLDGKCFLLCNLSDRISLSNLILSNHAMRKRENWAPEKAPHSAPYYGEQRMKEFLENFPPLSDPPQTLNKTVISTLKKPLFCRWKFFRKNFRQTRNFFTIQNSLFKVSLPPSTVF